VAHTAATRALTILPVLVRRRRTSLHRLASLCTFSGAARILHIRGGRSELNDTMYHDRYQRAGDGLKFTERAYEVGYLDTTPDSRDRAGPRLAANRPGAGGLGLALAVVLGAAALPTERGLVQAALAGYLVYSVSHLASHATHLDDLPARARPAGHRRARHRSGVAASGTVRAKPARLEPRTQPPASTVT
jgi:hypothetical protein